MTEAIRIIRIYSPFLPYPVTEGGFQVICDQATSLRRLGHEVELVVWKDNRTQVDAKLASRAGSTQLDPSIRITVLDPAGGRGADGETRAARLERVIRSWTSKDASPELFHYPDGFDAALAALGPADLGIYHYSFAHRWLRGRNRERLKAVHFLNLESDLSAARAAAAGGSWVRRPERLIHELNRLKLAAHEADLARLCDELWFVSAADRETYLRERPGLRDRTRVVAPTYSSDLMASRREAHRLWREKGGNEKIVGFVANLEFEPNRRSLAWILREVVPELARAGFDGRLRIAGRGAPAWLKELGQESFVEWLGFVPDLEEFWAGLSFLLSPRQGGSGVQTKLLEALASGVPVLANPEAASRIDPALRDSPLFWSSDRPEAWARRLRDASPCAERKAHENAVPGVLDGQKTYAFVREMGNRGMGNP